jgi:hypothetical protein
VFKTLEVPLRRGIDDLDLVVGLDAERIHQARRNVGDALSVLVRSPIGWPREKFLAGFPRASTHSVLASPISSPLLL